MSKILKEEILTIINTMSDSERLEFLEEIFEVYCKECFRKMESIRNGYLICYCTWDW